MKGKKKVAIVVIAVIILLSMVLIYENEHLELNSLVVESADLPEEFDGFRIVHLSDFHNAEIGENNKTLISVIEEAKPDIIVITGDIVDSRRTDIGVAVDFVREIVKIAPCYYVTGNHEARISDYAQLKQGLTEAGVILLDNKKITIAKSGAELEIMGIDDPMFEADYFSENEFAVVDNSIKNLNIEDNSFSLLLSHRPEMFEVYAENGLDLVLSGHAHGGQFRIPFIGGFIAPGQGLFPEYDAGLYEDGKTNMFVSRGIGNSIIPLRVNNRPEVVLIELNIG